jgi:hypothetical protein
MLSKVISINRMISIVIYIKHNKLTFLQVFGILLEGM